MTVIVARAAAAAAAAASCCGRRRLRRRGRLRRRRPCLSSSPPFTLSSLSHSLPADLFKNYCDGAPPLRLRRRSATMSNSFSSSSSLVDFLPPLGLPPPLDHCNCGGISQLMANGQVDEGGQRERGGSAAAMKMRSTLSCQIASAAAAAASATLDFFFSVYTNYRYHTLAHSLSPSLTLTVRTAPSSSRCLSSLSTLTAEAASSLQRVILGLLKELFSFFFFFFVAVVVVAAAVATDNE